MSLDGDGTNTLVIATEDLIKSSVSGADWDTIGISVGTPSFGSVVQTYDSLLIKIPPCGSFKTYALQGSVQVSTDTLMTSLGFAVGEVYPSFLGQFTGGVISAQTTVSDVLTRLLSAFYLNADLAPNPLPWQQSYTTTGYPTIRRDTDFTPDEILSLDKRLWGDVRNYALSPNLSNSISGQINVPVTYRDNENNTATANVVVSVSACGSNANTTPNTITLHADDINLDVCCEADSVNPALIAIQTILANATGDGVTLTGISTPLYGNAQITANGITYQSPPCGSFPAPPIAGHDTVTIMPEASVPPTSDCPFYGPNVIFTQIGVAARDYGTDNPTKDIPLNYIPAEETPGQIGGDVYAVGWVITYTGQKYTLAPGWQELGTFKSGGFTLMGFARTFDPSELTARAPAQQVIPMLLDVDIVNGDDGTPPMYLDTTLFSCVGRTTTPQFKSLDVYPINSGPQTVSAPNYGSGMYVKGELVLLTNADSGFQNPIVSTPSNLTAGYGHWFIKDYAMMASEAKTAIDPTDGATFKNQDAGFRIYRVFEGIYECIQVG